MTNTGLLRASTPHHPCLVAADRWWQGSVAYQIYTKSFCDSNGDGVGDLGGIIEKLDYLTWLGVDVLWLSPMYPSPGIDNGYDVSDYDSIDPKYGTLADFDELLEQSHARGLRVITDVVINHSSDAHPWFAASCRGSEPERDFYLWHDAVTGGGPPNNWGALFGGSAWTWNDARQQYYLHLFSPHQPDLNWESEQLREELYAMLRRWLDRGVDGFRLDVISLIAKPADLSDGPIGPSGFFDPRARIAANPRVHEHLRELRRRVLAGRRTMTVGEASATTVEQARAFSNPDGSELDMVFQFEHMDVDGGETFKWTDRRIDTAELKRVMVKWQQGLEASGWNGLFWNNHDQPRMLSRLTMDERWREMAAKLLGVCLHMMKGTPFIFQGEELAMTNAEFTSVAQLRDNESRNAFERYVGSGEISAVDMLRFISLKSRDNARTPMQWSDAAGAGFTSGTPWMDLNPNYSFINAAEQFERPDSVLAFYRELIHLRHEYPVIVAGRFVPVESVPEVLAFERVLDVSTSDDERLLVCCNFSDQSQHCRPPEGFDLEGAELLLTNSATSTYMSDHHLGPYEAVILLARPSLTKGN